MKIELKQKKRLRDKEKCLQLLKNVKFAHVMLAKVVKRGQAGQRQQLK